MRLDAGFPRRLKLYLFGFLMGALIVNVLFKGRACQMPGTIKLEELYKQKLEYISQVQCHMQCKKITAVDVEEVLKNGSINYGKSNVHNQPCPTYFVEGSIKNDQHLTLQIADCDSTSKILSINTSGEVSTACNCN